MCPPSTTFLKACIFFQSGKPKNDRMASQHASSNSFCLAQRDASHGAQNLGYEYPVCVRMHALPHIFNFILVSCSPNCGALRACGVQAIFAHIGWVGQEAVDVGSGSVPREREPRAERQMRTFVCPFIEGGLKRLGNMGTSTVHVSLVSSQPSCEPI